MAANGGFNLSKKQLISSALSKSFPIDPKALTANNTEIDTKSFCLNLLKASGNKTLPDNNNEVRKWIAFADGFPVDSGTSLEILKQFNEELVLKSVLVGNGLKPSEVDVIVFSVIHSSVIGLSNAEGKLPHVMRWIDYIQNKVDFGDLFETIRLEKAAFDPPLQGTKSVANLEGDSIPKRSLQSTNVADKAEENFEEKKNDDADFKKKKTADKETKLEKKKSPEVDPTEKDKEVSVSLLNLQVGLIRKAWKHPSADSLLVEEIDVGDAKLRQVVSGLAKFYIPDDLTNRLVVLITNVKPGKLRDVMSEGLVLCASNEDHTRVEPLIPPEGAKVGERVSFSGIDGKPEDVLNPKKKQLEKITLHLFTDDEGIATFKGIPFMTSSGPCTSSIPKASIK